MRSELSFRQHDYYLYFLLAVKPKRFKKGGDIKLRLMARKELQGLSLASVLGPTDSIPTVSKSLR